MKKIGKPIIVGNWKATPATLKEAMTFVKNLEKKIKGKKVNYLLAVPSVFINPLSELVTYGNIGAENISGVEVGQETGNSTGSMLASSGAEFTILGHSEVRARGETNEVIAKKAELALNQKLTTILCIGEKIRDKNGAYLSFLEEEIKQCLSLVRKELFNNLIIAYEPIWAIGGKNPATVHECFEVTIAIRRTLAEEFGIDYAKKVYILYGGTVTKENAKKFIEEGGVNGLLIGRASQNISDFSSIILSCHSKDR